MGRRTMVTGAAAACCATALAVGAAGGTAQPPSGFSERMLGFAEAEGRPQLVVDVPPREARQQRLSAGDSWIFTKALREGSRVAGHAHGRCVAFSSGRNPRAICDGVIRLADGSLSFLEVFRFNDRERHAAITGGTGAYAGATGTFRGGGDLGNRDEIRLLLPRS